MNNEQSTRAGKGTRVQRCEDEQPQRFHEVSVFVDREVVEVVCKNTSGNCH